MFLKDIAIDLGTSNTRVYVKGRGIILREPSVVAINKITSEILAVGETAREMLGRTPDNITALKPLKDGVIADFDGTRLMLSHFIEKAIPKSLLNKPRVVICVPSGVTDVEERAVEEVVERAGAKEVYLMEEPMAAAIGAGLKVDSPEGTMVVDIGAGTTEVAVLSLGGIVVAKSIRIGGDELDEAIIEYIKRQHNLFVGTVAAEDIKKQIGAAQIAMTEEKMEVKGRNLTTGLPETIIVTTSQIKDAMQEAIDSIVNVIKSALEQTPPELASDIMESGIVITGASAYIRNIDRYINEQTGIPVFIAEKAEDAVIKGAGMSLENIDILRRKSKIAKR